MDCDIVQCQRWQTQRLTTCARYGFADLHSSGEVLTIGVSCVHLTSGAISLGRSEEPILRGASTFRPSSGAEEVISFKHIFEVLFAITVLVCFVGFATAYLKLKRMDRAEKRRLARQLRKPSERAEDPIRRAG